MILYIQTEGFCPACVPKTEDGFKDGKRTEEIACSIECIQDFRAEDEADTDSLQGGLTYKPEAARIAGNNSFC